MWFVLHKVVALNEWHGRILQELDMHGLSNLWFLNNRVGCTHVT
jgi:hypothetical protein